MFHASFVRLRFRTAVVGCGTGFISRLFPVHPRPNSRQSPIISLPHSPFRFVSSSYSSSSSTLFSSSPILLQHLCPLCSKNFKSQPGLADHIIAKHPDELKTIHHERQDQKQQQQQQQVASNPSANSAAASETTADQSSGATSAAAVAPTTLYKCEHCTRSFKSRDACITHIKDKHKDLLLKAHQLYKEQQEKLAQQQQAAAQRGDNEPVT